MYSRIKACCDITTKFGVISKENGTLREGIMNGLGDILCELICDIICDLTNMPRTQIKTRNIMGQIEQFSEQNQIIWKCSQRFFL